MRTKEEELIWAAGYAAGFEDGQQLDLDLEEEITKQELIGAIFLEEEAAYIEFKEFKETFGAHDEATVQAHWKWYGISSLINNLNLNNEEL